MTEYQQQAYIYTDQMSQNAVAALIAAGTQAGLSIVYDATNHKLSFTLTSTPTFTSMTFGGLAISVNTAAPTGGTHAKGEIVINSSPTSSGTFAWVCTTAGTPGNWAPLTLGAQV